ncbi:MAG: glycosyltransferase [Sphingomonas sp.]
MIFASVGSMLPFDRLVRAVDDWAGENPDVPVLIQIGDGSYRPRHADWVRIMPHALYARRLAECALFVAHVGIGSIVQALEARKQILMLPRLASLGEHTTDHQLHTVARFRDTPGLEIAEDVPALQVGMTRLLAAPLTGHGTIPPFAPAAMTDRIRAFLGATANQ